MAKSLQVEVYISITCSWHLIARIIRAFARIAHFSPTFCSSFVLCEEHPHTSSRKRLLLFQSACNCTYLPFIPCYGNLFHDWSGGHVTCVLPHHLQAESFKDFSRSLRSSSILKGNWRKLSPASNVFWTACSQSLSYISVFKWLCTVQLHFHVCLWNRGIWSLYGLTE